MRSACVFAATLVASVVLAAAAPNALPDPVGGSCDDEYECEYQHTSDAGVTFSFDLRPLCRQGNDYVVNDTTGHTYNFQICGSVNWRCLPTWSNVYEFGVAVQHWGDNPPCNSTVPECVTNEGIAICCSQDCQVLGEGPPLWELHDPQNPETGGIEITHRGVPPATDDPFWCPWNEKTGSQYERSVTYEMACDPKGLRGEVNIISASENGTHPCGYTIKMSSIHGCGCAPECANKNCGPDGCGGFCGGGNGVCPAGYFCNDDSVCCRPDCNHRLCDNDGCGGSCGTCGEGQVCKRAQCVAASPLPSPVGSPSKSSPGTVAGSFFAGLFAAVVIGGVGIWWYNRQNGGGGTYTPYTTGGGSSSSAPASSSTAVTSGQTSSYGAL